VLAHNIIYAGIEYAAKYGFNPVPNFTGVTQYMLEENNDAIPLIDIHCGDEKGNPIYVNTVQESPTQEKQIIKRLSETAGEGNYTLPNMKDDSEYEQIKNSLIACDDDELKFHFIYTMNAAKATEGEKQQAYLVLLSTILDVMLEKLIDFGKLTQRSAKIRKMLDVKIVNIFDLPNSFFSGLQSDDVEAIAAAYFKVMEAFQAGELERPLQQFRDEIGDIPVAYYFELFYANISDSEYVQRLDDCSRKYPDYMMFKILRYARDPILREQFTTLLTNSGAPVTDIEFSEFLHSYAMYYLSNKDVDVEELIAFDEVIRQYQEMNINVEETLFMIFTIKTKLVGKYYKIDGEDKR
jgi:hypothetical protein